MDRKLVGLWLLALLVAGLNMIMAQASEMKEGERGGRAPTDEEVLRLARLREAEMRKAAGRGNHAYGYPPYFAYNFTQIVESHGYPCEVHQVRTNDGYLLTVFRIPPKKRGGPPPVLLQHGLLDSSFTYATTRVLDCDD